MYLPPFCVGAFPFIAAGIVANAAKLKYAGAKVAHGITSYNIYAIAGGFADSAV
jgi:hypothetical protein